MCGLRLWSTGGLDMTLAISALVETLTWVELAAVHIKTISYLRESMHRIL